MPRFLTRVGTLLLLLAVGIPARSEAHIIIYNNNISIIDQPLHEVYFPAGPDTVAVMPFTNATGDAALDWLCVGIPETITADLIALDRFVIVERLQLWRIMEEQALQLTGAVDEDAMVQIGKLLGARHLIVGAFQRAGELVRLTARFVATESGNVIRSTKMTGAMENIFELQDSITGSLVDGLKSNAVKSLAVPEERRMTRSLTAYRRYSEALLLQARHDYAGAWAQFCRALDVDPGFGLARQQLREVMLPLTEEGFWEYAVEVVRGEGIERRWDEIWQVGPTAGSGDGSGYTLIRQSPAGTGADPLPVGIQLAARETGLVLTVSLHAGGTDALDEVAYKPPLLVLPWELKAGRKWLAADTSPSRTGPQPGARRDRIAVLGRVNLKVPDLGLVDCFELRHEPVPGAAVEALTIWFAPGIGIVRIEAGADPGTGSTVAETGRTTWRLTARSDLR